MPTGQQSRRFRRTGWFVRIFGHPDFQARIRHIPILSHVAARNGQHLFEQVQGFVSAQVLFALVALDIPRRLLDDSLVEEGCGELDDIPAEKIQLLLQAGAAIGILKRHRDGRYSLTRQGAVTCGVPGLREMILHHQAFYRDMTDPLSLLKNAAATELSTIWPYVRDGGAGMDPAIVDSYSLLMAESQTLVAQDSLRLMDLNRVRRLMDVGGGSGAFLIAAGAAQPELDMMLFDLPEVTDRTRGRIENAGLSHRVAIHSGSFLRDPLPIGADAISLIRVLYDHSDAHVATILKSCFAALPPGGILLVSEPMSGGTRPDSITDVYFAFYTLAMRSGRTRTSQEIASLAQAVGFRTIRTPSSPRPYVTSVLTARRPG